MFIASEIHDGLNEQAQIESNSDIGNKGEIRQVTIDRTEEPQNDQVIINSITTTKNKIDNQLTLYNEDSRESIKL